MISRSALVVAIMLTALPSAARQAPNPVVVDSNGVMRWTRDGAEVALFGVNYTTPFAHAYRAHERLGVDHKAAIDADVAHMARLGFDAYRVHVWDREVADSVGNLVENVHLDLYDYLVARLAERGIHTILTPIAWWGNGYPEGDRPMGAFTDRYSKGEMTTDPAAIAAQERYVEQFARHVNPYRGLAYRDDAAVIAMELFNEPNHPDPERTTAFIDALAAAARRGGWTKPVFYNISENYFDGHGRSVCSADIQGVSMQWYPTGLVRNRSLGGNALPNADRYPTPFDAFDECADKARMVYEFDAADVPGSFMYPAMTRAFRGAGVQFATQFAYDPLAMAWANTEYQTHFVNLVYAPSKAISLMIGAEAFRRVPYRASYPAYPASARFEAGGATFVVSYEEDLSLVDADTLFAYSNSTDRAPNDPAALRHVAGVGSSPVVRYGGTGAYFLDRVGPGAWRLEVYPDAVWAEDPFTRGSLDRQAVVLMRQRRPMRIHLADLGHDFEAVPLDDGNGFEPSVQSGAFVVVPGAYLLLKPGAPRPERIDPTYFAPPASARSVRVVYQPPAETEVGATLDISVRVASAEPVDSVWVVAAGFGRSQPVRLATEGGVDWTGSLTAPPTAGLLEYRISVYSAGSVTTFPGAHDGLPLAWDYTGPETYAVPIVEADASLVLFDASRDRDRLLVPHPWRYVRFRVGTTAGRAAGDLAVRAEVTDLTPDPQHFALRSHLPDGLSNRLHAFGDEAELVVTARSTETSESLEVALVLRDGSAWGTRIGLEPGWSEYRIPVSALSPVDLYLLPRPYPQFLPYRFRPSRSDPRPDLAGLDGLQFAIGGDGIDVERGHGFDIERVELRPRGH